MQLAIFDLDNTLISGDSDYEWGQYLVSLGLVDAVQHTRENQRFYEQYKAGTLDIHEYARFAFRPFTEHSMDSLLQWRTAFVAERITPLIRAKARTLVDEHRGHGHTLVIITSTNRFLADPIAKAFGVDNLIATELAMREGRYTGEIEGEPALGKGKIVRLEQWLQTPDLRPQSSWAYSDSHNDIPLLEWADHAIAVDPDPLLAAHAGKRGWSITSLA